MSKRQPWWWGGARFGEDEEHELFRFRFLITALGNAVLVAAVFSLADLLHLVDLSLVHRWAVRLFAPFNAMLLAMVWGHRDRFAPVCWAYWSGSLLLNLSGLLTLQQDELRVLWFFMHLGSSFILLGARAGVVTGLLSMLAVASANPLLMHPYSPTAMVTLVSALMATSLMFLSYARHVQQTHTAIHESRSRLRQLSTQDPLTGVLNVRGFQKACEPHLLASDPVEMEAKPCSLLFIDIDHLRQVNDQYGHNAGDALLCGVATALQAQLRGHDILGRVGGEEFCVFLPSTHGRGALRVAERLRSTIEALPLTIGGAHGVRVSITASIGVAVQEPGMDSLSALQRHANQAMYRAKEAGCNQVSGLEGIAQEHIMPGAEPDSAS